MHSFPLIVALIIALVSAEPTAASHAASQACAPAPLSLAGDAGVNIRIALDANHGRLRHVIISPGETWSFNATLGSPRQLVGVRDVNGVPGGGWCDLASRYVQAVRPLLPRHAVKLRPHTNGLRHVAPQDAAAIWNPDGTPGFADGRADVLITNTLSEPLALMVKEQRSAITVCAFTLPRHGAGSFAHVR